jgi:nitric oxide reductase NorD protein
VSAPLPAGEVRQRLEALVFRVLTSRRSVEGPARELALCDGPAQERFLGALELIAATSVELAYSLCMFGVPALRQVPAADWQDWVLHLMALYDQGGVLPCIGAMQRVESYVRERAEARDALELARVSGVLEHFLRGLSGRDLRLVAGESAYTDTETLYLPERLARFSARDDNYRLYKALVAHLWAQTWFGTWRRPVLAPIRTFPDPERALRLFHALETLRLDACIARELPGLHREMSVLGAAQGRAEPGGAWAEAARVLALRDAGVSASHEWLPRVYAVPGEPQPLCYQGSLFPERTEEAMVLRQAREREALQRALARLADEHGGGRRAAAEPFFSARQVSAPRLDTRIDLLVQGEPLRVPPDVQQLLGSIEHDFGELPESYLDPAGWGRYQNREGAAGGTAPEPAEAAHVYDEWDYQRRGYRHNWCLLRERDVHPVADDFVPRTLVRHGGLLKHLHRTFEALRGDERRLRRQPFGDDIDLDAVVQCHVDRRLGLECGDQLFTRRRVQERDIAVLFMVDMSGSTRGWINELQREALVLLCACLETLGDRYAIYGFSGFTHKRCELLRVKRFEEPYGEEVRARISGIRPQDYTRMGVAIRHLTGVLNRVEARTRLLVTLSDGRPDDQDGYRGRYGIEDTRQALIEARNAGVHPYCVTIDQEAPAYLPHMYGPAGFTLVSQVERLPYRVSDIYRRITR